MEENEGLYNKISRNLSFDKDPGKYHAIWALVVNGQSKKLLLLGNHESTLYIYHIRLNPHGLGNILKLRLQEVLNYISPFFIL